MSFKLATSSGNFYVAHNATKHMAEYLGRGAVSSASVAVRGQVMLQSFTAAVEAAALKGITYGDKMIVGGWELVFKLPRAAGELPAVVHALMH